MIAEPRVSPAGAQPPLVIALDLGSSSARVALFDAAGRLVDGTLRRARVAWSIGADGAVETDAERLVRRACALIDRLVVAWPELAASARLGVVSTLFHSFAGVDDTRRPVTPLVSWSDTRAVAAARRLRELVDPVAAHDRTGAPIHPGCWPARVALWRERAVVGGWAGLPELVLHRLTGRWLTGLSIAGGTGLLDRRSRDWDVPLLEALQLDPGALPPLHRTLEPVGGLTPAAAARWPALADVEWLAPIGDGACGSVGLGAVGWGAAAVMVGTSSAVRLLVPGDPPVAQGLFAYPLEGTGTLLGGALSEGGGTLEWWANIAGEPLAMAVERATAGQRAAGVVALPHLAGERGPGYRADAGLVLAGLRAWHGVDDVLRALIEGIAVSLAELHHRLVELAPAPPRIVAGGGALSRFAPLAQAVCDALGRPLEVSAVSEPSLRGAALLALHAAGLLPLTSESPPGYRLEPDPARSAALGRLRERRRRLYAALYRQAQE
jgi:gluconokinase